MAVRVGGSRSSGGAATPVIVKLSTAPIRLTIAPLAISRRLASLATASISSALRTSMTTTGYLPIMGLSACSIAAAHHRAPASRSLIASRANLWATKKGCGKSTGFSASRAATAQSRPQTRATGRHRAILGLGAAADLVQHLRWEANRNHRGEPGCPPPTRRALSSLVLGPGVEVVFLVGGQGCAHRSLRYWVARPGAASLQPIGRQRRGSPLRAGASGTTRTRPAISAHISQCAGGLAG